MKLAYSYNYRFKIKNLSLFVALVLLLFALVLRVFFINGFRSEEQYFRDIASDVEAAMEDMEDEAEEVREMIKEADQLQFDQLYRKSPYSYYIFAEDKRIYWSDYRQVPTYSSLEGDYTYRYKSINGSNYIVLRDTVSSSKQKLEYFLLLPIFRDHKIDNKYISSGYNQDIFPQETIDVREISDFSEADRIVSYQDVPLFEVALSSPQRGYREHRTARSFQALLSFMITLAIALIIYNIFESVHRKLERKQFGASILLVILSLLGVRFVMLYFDFPHSIMPLKLFDGRFYASSNVNPSLGDLLLNSLCLSVICIYLFKYYAKTELYHKIVVAGKKQKSLFAIVLLLSGIMALYAHYYIVKTIYFNSQWTLDITENLRFPALKIISLVIFVINTVSYFLFSHIVFRIFIKLSDESHLSLRWLLLIVLFLTLGMNLLWDVPPVSIILISFLYLGLLHAFSLPRYLTRVSYVTFLYLFASALVSAITGAMAAYDIKKVDVLDNKQKFANQLLVDNDVLGEYLLNEITDKISEDKFIKYRLYNTLSSKDAIRQKINRIYLSNYFDRYDVSIHLFNSRGKAIDNRNLPDYEQFVEITKDPRFSTEYADIFFINQSTDQRYAKGAPKRYLTLLELEDYNTTIGYIIIDMSLKRFIPNRVYPELLIDRRYLESYPSNDYDYAIFNASGNLTYSSGDEVAFRKLKGYEFDEKVDNDKVIDRGGFSYLIIKGKPDEYIVIASEQYALINVISNFSFLFLLLIFALLLMMGAYAIYFAFKDESLNFSTKIQLYLNAAFFMPLLAVSITTLSVISRSYSEEVDEQYLRKAQQIGGNILDVLDNYQKGAISEEVLNSTLSQVARYAETDANIFNAEGKLIATSQPLIYEDSLLSPYINPLAMANIREQDNNRLVLDESVGTLSYKSSYIGLKSPNTGQLMAMLSLPFFESRSELEQQIIKVMTNIMNIFTFVFIVFLIISYLASVLLTYPLQYITHKIRRTSLADYNEPLSWDTNDEIGLMIGEYNKMLVKLEASKAALARSEKESAWREMAQQVAHEIKNPLTPMKLSLQHLRRKLEVDYKTGMNADDVVLVSKPFENLLHQIETLSDIANSFSNFAKMPTPKSEFFEFSVLLRKVVGLYEDGKETIRLSIEEGEYHIVSDQQLMGRIISNLLINARQSIPPDREPRIEISLQRIGGNKLILKIADNGTGIAKEIQHKVFLPNFSTKYAGSGIGLAITKRGIEHAGGRIAFDTILGRGTTFFIELPLVLNGKALTPQE
ncbi:MAG: ATP-binding protein [Cyclobacteriaceae bacterium]